MRFNLSRSHEIGLCAVAYGQDVGVDVEWMRPLDAMATLVNRFFSPKERTDWNQLEESQKLEAFYCYWTCKEAFVKARGEGLGFPLNAFDVALFASAPPRLMHIQGDAIEAANWSVQTLTPATDYQAAVALPGLHWQVERWRWPESA